jgi:hypothetical protein
MDDALMGELLVPDDELPAGWREALTAIAHRTRDAWARHPWAIEAMRSARFGPNGMKHVEQSLAAVAGTGLDPVGQMQVMGMVDDYVLGFCVGDSAVRSTLLDDESGDALAPLLTYVAAHIEAGEYPHMRGLLGEGDLRANWERLATAAFGPDRFELGLSRLLDGIELYLAQRRG